jgi:hypothetical protein
VPQVIPEKLWPPEVLVTQGACSKTADDFRGNGHDRQAGQRNCAQGQRTAFVLQKAPGSFD